MNSADANREALRELRQDPVLLAVELFWRWCFGLGLLAICFFCYSHLRQAILLTDIDQAALTSQDLLRITVALADVVRQSMPLLVKTLANAAWAAGVLWILVSTAGRSIVTRTVVLRQAKSVGASVALDASRWCSYFALMVARTLMTLILVIGYVGGGMAAALFSPERQMFLSLAVFLAVFVGCGLVWWYVNWVLSLAPIFVARDGASALDAIVTALGFARRRFSVLVPIATWNGSVRSIAAVVLSMAGFACVGLANSLPSWMVFGLLAIESFLYLVISDTLVLLRYVAYIHVAVQDRLPEASAVGRPDLVKPDGL